VSNKLVLSRVNNEGAIFYVFANAQKAQVANARLNNYLVIVLIFVIVPKKINNIVIRFGYSFSSTITLTPLGRTAIIEGEIDTFTEVQLSGAASLLIFSMASFMVFMPTACCTSLHPRY
jgi:hypothetical protein